MNINKDMLKDTDQEEFILIKHDIPVDGEMSTHWDIRLPESGREWSLVGNPVDRDEIHGVARSEMTPVKEGTVRVGSIDTENTKIDSGSVQVIENPDSTSFVFGGDKLRGIWVTTKEDDRILVFKKH